MHIVPLESPMRISAAILGLGLAASLRAPLHAQVREVPPWKASEPVPLAAGFAPMEPAPVPEIRLRPVPCAAPHRDADAPRPTRSAPEESSSACGEQVFVGAAAGATAGGALSLLYLVGVCLPRSFRQGPACGGTLPLLVTVGGGVLGGIAGLRSPACRSRD